MIVVKDNSIPLKALKIGVDDDLLKRYASKMYIEHLLKRQDNSAMVSSQAVVPGEDPLYAASQNNVYSMQPTTRPKKKEQGIKI